MPVRSVQSALALTRHRLPTPRSKRASSGENECVLTPSLCQITASSITHFLHSGLPRLDSGFLSGAPQAGSRISFNQHMQMQRPDILTPFRCSIITFMGLKGWGVHVLWTHTCQDSLLSNQWDTKIHWKEQIQIWPWTQKPEWINPFLQVWCVKISFLSHYFFQHLKLHLKHIFMVVHGFVQYKWK